MAVVFYFAVGADGDDRADSGGRGLGRGNEGRLGFVSVAEPMRVREMLTIWSRTRLKSSRKMVSEAHLKTRASYALISIGTVGALSMLTRQ